ncbi:hypothetical protein GF494_26800, partial [Klebsiella pneumoniae]|nr:hypothetical protein [Klebsiella pneumoniae]
ENDQKLVADMTATVFSPELQNSARRDGQEIQLKALQQYWQLAALRRQGVALHLQTANLHLHTG